MNKLNICNEIEQIHFMALELKIRAKFNCKTAGETKCLGSKNC